MCPTIELTWRLLSASRNKTVNTSMSSVMGKPKHVSDPLLPKISPFPPEQSSNLLYNKLQGLDGGGGAAGLLSSALQGITTVTAFNMQEKLSEDYKKASEVVVVRCGLFF